jgi:hypothetical protein
LTKLEIIDKLRSLDEVSVLDLLGLSSDDLVDAFLDKIDERIERISKELEE